MVRTAAVALILGSVAWLWSGQDSLPSSFVMNRLSPRVLDFYGGPGSVKSHVVVAASERGLVVIDTSISPRLAGEVKAAAARELGRSDFRFVILTHSHNDHAWGAAAFEGADVVAHRRAGERLAKLAAGNGPALAEERAYSRARIAEWREEMDRCAPESKAAATYRLIIAREESLVRDFEAGFKVVPPSIVFDDRMTLDLGNLKAELIAFGPAHSEDDILVFFPEEGLLLTGDLAFDFSLGSPQPKATLPSGRFDVPRWLRALDDVLSGPRLPGHVIAAHRREIMSGGDLARRRAYLGAAWDRVKQALAGGKKLDDVLDRAGLDNLFPEALSWPLAWSGAIEPEERRIRHANLLRLFWREAEWEAR